MCDTYDAGIYNCDAHETSPTKTRERFIIARSLSISVMCAQQLSISRASTIGACRQRTLSKCTRLGSASGIGKTTRAGAILFCSSVAADGKNIRVVPRCLWRNKRGGAQRKSRQPHEECVRVWCVCDVMCAMPNSQQTNEWKGASCLCNILRACTQCIASPSWLPKLFALVHGGWYSPSEIC